jgi:hypothetical protein
MTQLWFDQPSILMNKSYITELFPKDTMSSNQKLNAIVRVVILLSMIGYIVTKSPYIPIIALVSMFATVIYGKSVKKEGMTNPLKTELDFQNDIRVHMSKDVNEHTMPSKSNPLMNVQLTEINDNPTRKPAAPSYNPTIQEKIHKSSKEKLDPRLFKNVGDEIQFEHSMQRFHTTANTEIPNDQEGFAKFCYGTMPSCRGGDDKACIKNNYRHILR